MKINLADMFALFVTFLAITVYEFFIKVIDFFKKWWVVFVIFSAWFLLPFLFVWIENAPLYTIWIWHFATFGTLFFAYIYRTFFEQDTWLYGLISQYRFIKAVVKSLPVPKEKREYCKACGRDVSRKKQCHGLTLNKNDVISASEREALHRYYEELQTWERGEQ